MIAYALANPRSAHSQTYMFILYRPSVNCDFGLNHKTNTAQLYAVFVSYHHSVDGALEQLVHKDILGRPFHVSKEDNCTPKTHVKGPSSMYFMQTTL